MIDKEPIYNEETGEARMRTPDEIQEAEHEMYERRWYDRHTAGIQAGRRGGGPEMTEILTKACEAADRVEATYGKESLQPMSDFEWGVLSGRHYALRWVLGDEWENGDT